MTGNTSMINAFNHYNTQLASEEQGISGQLTALSQAGKNPSLSDMMNFTLKINSVMTKATLMMTQNANYFKMLNNIAQRAVVS